jgi:trehalose 6-phosphate phosphatase
VRIGTREPSLAQSTLPGPAAAEAWLSRVLDALTHGAIAHAGFPEGKPTNG